MEEWPTSSETTIMYLQNYVFTKHLPLLNLNNTTDLFPWVSYQFLSFKRETGMLLPRSEREKKKSCNPNSMKNTEMLEKYIFE
jgi:hypothetical protein